MYIIGDIPSISGFFEPFTKWDAPASGGIILIIIDVMGMNHDIVPINYIRHNHRYHLMKGRN